jgi:hypothetical protein
VAFVFLGFLWIIFMRKHLRFLEDLPLTEWLVQQKPNVQKSEEETKDDDVEVETRVKLATSMEAL